MTRSREVSKGATRNEFIYTATATQTTFSGNDDNSNSLAYTVGQIDVFMNGIRLAPADFTATNGTSVVLGSGAIASDIIQINAFGTFSVADVIVDRLEFDYTATAGQTSFTGSDNDSQTMAYTAGRIDVYLNGSRLNVTDDYTATNGTSVVLEAGAQAGDSLVVVAHGTVNLASNILSGDLDLNGNELILDVDGDTSITADTDDQIDIKLAGTDFVKIADQQVTLTSSTASRPGVVLLDTNADANPPFLRFQKDSASPADNDEVGIIQFYADDDGGNVFIPADIVTTTPDVSDSSEDGKIAFRVSSAGTKAERLAVESNQVKVADGSVVLIGGQASDSVGGATCNLQLEGTSTADSSISLKCNTNGTTAPTLRFGKSRGTSLGSDTVVQDGDELGVIVFAGADGTDTETQGAVIIAAVDGTPGGNDLPTRLLFNTTADGASGTSERMRIHQEGVVSIGTANKYGKLSVQSSYNDGPYGRSVITAVDDDPTADSNNQIMVLNFSGDGDITSGTGVASYISFRDSGGEIGHVSGVNTSTITFSTTSDYRLKENVDYSWDATTRLKQLKPCRFNFIADSTNTLQDGFLAHEVSSVVPEAVQGDKDGTRTANNVVKKADGTLHVENVTEAEWTAGKLSTTDSLGNTIDPIYASDTTWASSMTTPVRQMIDHSKLVPLLVKTIQELEARIKTLEDA